MQRYGAWLGEVLERIDEPSAIVAGHSLGAAIALAAEPSPKIKALALIGPAGLARVRITPKLLWVTTRWMARPSPNGARALIRFMQHPDSPTDPERTDWLVLVAGHTKQTGAPGPLQKAQLDRWHGNVLVTTGSADALFPPSRLQKPAHDTLGTTIEVISDAGHLLPDEQPQQLAKLLTEFAHSLG